MPKNDQRLVKFGENVKYLREKQSLTQNQVAQKCGFSSSYFKLVEAGQTNISFLRLIKLSQILQVKPEVLIFDL